LSGVFRRSTFWVAYAALAVAALAIAWRLFPLAIPLVSLDIKLARDDAIALAAERAGKLDLAPPGARTAARFAHDQALQNYVELEGGGKAAFAALVAGNDYAPYWWEVRLFAPGEVTESVIRFRPDGGTNGFSLKLAETWVPADPSGLALPADAARRLAEERARADWGIDLAAWTPLEQTSQARTTGRVDHAFVYERKAAALGEARIRLRLALAGDRLTEVAPFAHVPESFQRRFDELRSANNTIAGVASLAAGLFYGLGGCVLGVLWLLRRHWLLWRPALAAGAVVGGLVGATLLAATPTAWFGFDTAQSETTFWIRQIGTAVLAAGGGAAGYALAFMAAESLSRRAFGDHPQLWRVWSRDAAATRAIAGRTIGGYLFVALELALISAFYYATNRWLGWWQPSESLTDPNILGSAIPALAPIALSLQAGFMEECVFRAIPLSLAALVGARYGHRGLAIGVAVVVQALIFGGAHANYPGFPAYSRLVELFVPSVLWALIFLRFGLVPTIVLHALFDLVLFSIPLFLVDAPGSGLQRGLVIAAGLVPLGVLLVRRASAGAWGELAAQLRNAAWRPLVPEAAHAAQPAERPPAPIAGWVAAFQRALPWLAGAGFVLWALATPWRPDVPALPQDRAAAIARADALLAANGVVLPPGWLRFAVPKSALDDPAQQQWHKFVWREAGADAYRALVGGALAPPLWEVRYARFIGDVADRAEEWRVTLTGDGAARGIRHALPEARPGAKLARDDAQALADKAVRERLQDEPAALTRIGAEEKQRPARVDWSFVYADPRVDVGKGGQARVLVNLAGDEIAGAGRFVHVPEEWQRAEREREGRLTLVKVLVAALSAIVALAALVFAVLRWTRSECDRRALVAVGAISLAAAALSGANRWPSIAMSLQTAEPIASQAALAIGSALVGGLLLALAAGLTAGAGAWAAQRQAPQPPAGRANWAVAGVAALLFAAGIGAAVEALAPRSAPLWPSYAQESTWLPPLAAALDGLRVLTLSGVAVFALDWLRRLTADYSRRRFAVALLLVVAFAGAGLASGEDVVAATLGGLVDGLLAIVVVYAVLRFDYRTVPAYLAAAVVLGAATSAAQKGVASAWVGAAITAAVAIASAWLVARYIDAARRAASR
jgi:hypothetical protein